MIASNITTIPIAKSVLKELKGAKQYPRQTYSELLLEMARVYKLCQPSKSQYDEFLHKVQQHKMKELWDNKEDKLWQKQAQELAVKRGWSEAHELFEF
jgi:hypothetical protein